MMCLLALALNPLPTTATEFSVANPLFDQTSNASPTPPAERTTSIGAYYSDIELGEVDFEGPGGSVTVLDVPRTRFGGQFDFGDAYLRVYAEEVGDDEFDGFGFGVGARGQRPLGGGGGKVDVLLDYDISVDLAFLSEDVLDSDLYYLELAGKLGAGIGVDSFVASGGVAGSFLFGQWDVPGASSTVDVEATNIGFYVGAGVRPGELPIKARVDVLFGDIEGVVLTAGFAF